MNLYEKIGDASIREVIEEFYGRAFRDPLIGHFFFQLDHQELIEKQIIFTSCMLGAQHLTYRGKSLRQAHSRLPLTEVHFQRRKRLMQEVLREKNIEAGLAGQWLVLEDNLKSLIINSAANCKV